MKFFSIVSVSLTLALFSFVDGLSGDDCGAPTTVTELNFHQSNLVTNTLHETGGELRYQGVGTYNDASIDLRVKALGPTDYTVIADSWEEREKENQNGFGGDGGVGGEGTFGKINLQTKEGEALSGQGTFEFCIVKTADSSLVPLTNFSFTIWDLDWRREEIGTPPDKISVKEKLIIDTSQAKNYSLFPTFEESKVYPICEDGSAVDCTDNDCSGVHPGHSSCPEGVNTVFQSTEFGTGDDNPQYPETLDDVMRKRAVYFVFEDRACFELTYAHFCPIDDPNNQYEPIITGYTGCHFGGDGYSGGNFLFAGNSEALFHQDGCPTGEPTTAPSVSPTKTPTTNPSLNPTWNPTLNPTKNPTLNPTLNPTKSPTITTGQCPIIDEVAEAGIVSKYGQLKMCVRSSLGYSYGVPSIFKEVNFIESLITIKYNLDAGFCVAAFNVEPKQKEETIVKKDQYTLEAWLCDPANLEYRDNEDRSLPTSIDSTYLASYETESEKTYFNQGALLQVCVAPDATAHADGLVMSELTTFTWKRDDVTGFSGKEVIQPAIETNVPSGNLLTAYNPIDCNGNGYCTFSSILIADFYINRGIVAGSGSAKLEFDTRRLEENRRLQDDDSNSFGLSIDVNGIDDGPGALRTAGGDSFGPTSLASVMTLLGISLLAIPELFVL